MRPKRRLGAIVLLTLTLFFSTAHAAIHLKPYEVPSAYGTAVEILAPNVYLLLHNGALNKGRLNTALVLLDHGQKTFEQRLPDQTADGENLCYRLFVADENRYGILTTESHSDFIRFQLLENGALSFTEAHALTEPSQFYLARSDSSGRLLFAKMLKAADINVRVDRALLRDDGSTTLYGTATRTARRLFAAFRLELDADGNIAARDVRDFTTRASYLYSVKLDPLGRAYVVADDYEHPIAVVPFEALPTRSDIELVLE